MNKRFFGPGLDNKVLTVTDEIIDSAIKELEMLKEHSSEETIRRYHVNTGGQLVEMENFGLLWRYLMHNDDIAFRACD